MLNGKTITLLTPTVTYDEDHDRVTTYTSTTIDNVLIAPHATSDVTSDTHVDGINVDYQLAFPKTWTYQTLKGCLIQLPAPWNYKGKVVGDPIPNDVDNCPTQWYLTVELEAYDG